MKNLCKLFAVVMALALVVLAFAACGGKTLSGTYSTGVDIAIAGTSHSFTFKGNKVTETTVASLLGTESTTTKEGTYKIVTDEEGATKLEINYKKDDSTTYSLTYSFGEGKEGDGRSYILIDGTKYYKK